MDYEKMYNEVCDKYIPRIRELEEENRSLKNELMEDMKYETKLEEENKKLKEKIGFLEQCLDNKEKVNKQLREELKELNKMMLFETELEK